jgi:hypothetical protein
MIVAHVMWDECPLETEGRIIMKFIADTVAQYRNQYDRSAAVWVRPEHREARIPKREP